MTWVQAVAWWQYHSIFLKDNWDAYTVWYNNYWQLWDWTTTNTLTPVLVMTWVQTIAWWWSHSIFLKNNWDAYATWDNYYWQLWDWTTSDRLYPVTIMTSVQDIALWRYHSIFLKDNWDIYTVWRNNYGQLWDWTTEDTSDPIYIQNLNFDWKVSTWSEDICTNVQASTWMTHYWAFEEWTWTTAYDSYWAENLYVSTWTTWNDWWSLSGYLSLDWDNYLKSNLISDFVSTDITAIFWIKTSDSSKTWTILSFAAPLSEDEFAIKDQKSLKVIINWEQIDSGLALNDNTWHNIWITWTNDGWNLKIYESWSLVYSTTWLKSAYSMLSKWVIAIWQSQWCIWNCFNSDEAFIWDLDDIAIYEKELRANEIENIYWDATDSNYNYCEITSFSPVANNLSITWSTTISWATLTWNYVYSDWDSQDTESWSTFKWYRSDTIDWTYSILTWETAINYTVSSLDNEKYLKFEVTPRSNKEPLTWSSVTSSWFWIDWNPPTWWSFTINNWSWSTSLTWVTLNITCASESVWAWSLPISYAFWNTANPTNWSTCTWAETFNTSHTLIWLNWSKIVYLRFKDSLENIANDQTWSIILDTTAPTSWSFTINSWALETNSSWVTLNVSCPNDTYSEPSQYAYWNSSNPSNWSTCSWSLNTSHFLDDSSESSKTVYMQFRDSLLNTTNEITGAIIYDTTIPSWWLVSNINWYINNTSINVTVNRWSDWLSWISDTDSDYELEYRNAWLSWWTCLSYESWTWALVNETSTSTWYIFSWSNGKCYQFRYSVKDKAWNSNTFTTTDTTKVVTSNPTAACSITEATNPWNQLAWSNSIYYNSNLTWSFIVNVNAWDTYWWIEKVIFPSLWTWFTWSWEDNTSTYNQEYNWNETATSSPNTMTATVVSNSSLESTCSFTIWNDSIPSTWWLINYVDWYKTNTSALTLSVNDWNDAGAWINTWSRILEVSSSILFWWNCISFWDYSQSSYTWSYPSIEQITNYDQWKCYQYRWKISDNVNNQITFTWASVIKVDITEPTLTIDSIDDSADNLFYSVLTLYYKTLSTISRIFTVETSSNDDESWIEKVNFQYIWAWFTWSWDINNTPYTWTYSILASTSASKTWIIVTSYNNASLTKEATFEVLVDNNNPINNWVTCLSDYDIDDWTFTLTWSSGQDNDSWLDTTISFFQSKTWSLAWNNCTYTDDFTNTWSANATSLSENLRPNWCYQYIYKSIDYVWNISTWSTCTVKVDTTIPSVPIISINENSNYIYSTWTILYYANTFASTQTFSIVWSVSDIDTSIENVNWENEFWDTPSNSTWTINLAYSIDNWQTCSWNDISVTAINYAWGQSSNNITCSLDNSSPVSWSVSNTDWFEQDAIISVIVNPWTDAISWMSPNPNDYLLELSTGALIEWSCSWFWNWTDAWVTETSTSTWYNVNSQEWLCYQFRYLVKDRVYNQSIFTWSLITKVSSQNPVVTSCFLEEIDNPEYQIINTQTNIYYNSNQTWSFKLNITSSASIAWIESINLPSIWAWFVWSSTCLSWSCSQIYTWATWAWDPWTQVATIFAYNWNTVTCDFKPIEDSLSPSIWSISFTNEYRNLLSELPTMSVSNWSDNSGWAWINTNSQMLLRSDWVLSWNLCLNYSSYNQIAYTGSLPNISDDSSIYWWECYKYQWSVEDEVGNKITYSDSNNNQYKVDITKPTTYVNNMTWSNTNIFYNTWNKELFYKTTNQLESFTINSYADDPESEIYQIFFPYLSSWFSNSWIVSWSTGQYFYDYSYNINASTAFTTWTREIVWTNNAMLTETWTFFVTNDNDYPVWVSIDCQNEFDTNWDYIINWSYWSDPLSWLNSSINFIQISTWVLAWNACSWTSTFLDTWSQEETNLSQTWKTNWCYLYRYHSTDLVWNEIYTDSCTLKVDTTVPTQPQLWITESSDYIYYDSTWNIMYYSNLSQTWINFTTDVTTSDWESDIQIVSWSLAFWDTPSDNTWTTSLNYSIENWSSCSSQITVVSKNNASLTNQNSITCIEDNIIPISWTVNNVNWYSNVTWIVVSTYRWIDTTSLMSFVDSDYILEYTSSILSNENCWPFTWGWLDANVNEYATSTWYLFSGNHATCYMFRYTVSDMVNNSTIWTWSDVTKVDITKPILSWLQTSENSNYVYFWSSSWILYFNNQYYSDFDIEMWSADGQSGIKSSSWSTQFNDTPVSTTAPFSLKYTIWTWEICSWASIGISLTNKALLTSTWDILCQKDIWSPYSWSIAYSPTYEINYSMPVYVDRWKDTYSQLSVKQEDYTFDFRTKTLTWDTCQWTFSQWTWSTITWSIINPWYWFSLITWSLISTSTWYNFIPDTWKCYQFRYNVMDNVANPSTWTWTMTTKVDKTTPVTSVISLTDNTDYLHTTWSTIFYNSTKSDSGSLNFVIQTEDLDTNVYRVYWSTEFWDSPVNFTWSYSSWSITWTYSIAYWAMTWETCDSENLIIKSQNFAWWITNIPYACYNDTSPPQASVEITNEWVYNNSWILTLTFSDLWTKQSLVRDCRYANDNPGKNFLEWTDWEQCTTTRWWLFTESYWTRTVYFQVRDNVWNITKVSNKTIVKFIDRAEYWSTNSPRSISHWSSELSNFSYKELETKDSVGFGKIVNWITLSDIKIKHVTNNHYATLPKWTQIHYSDGKIFDWIITPPIIVNKTTVPLMLWNVPPLRIIQMWADNWKTIYFSNKVDITFSTKWISSVVDRSDIQVYSYKEKTGKYTLESNNVIFNPENETITVSVDHMTTFVLMHWKEVQNSMDAKKIYTPFMDIAGHWSQQFIEKLFTIWVLARKLQFYPDSYLTRTELIKIAIDSFEFWINKELTEQDYKDINFRDTQTGAWYAPYLVEAVRIWLIDKAINKDVDLDYISYPYEQSIENNTNLQKMLYFIGYDIQITWDYDNQTRSVLRAYQEKHWFRTVSWRPWIWTIAYLNDEPDFLYSIYHDWHFKSSFRPLEKVTRAEAMKVILKAAWTKDFDPWDYENKFKDIEKWSWYSKYLLYWAAKWIIKWYPNFTIDPWGFVTRGQMSALTTRAIEVVRP